MIEKFVWAYQLKQRTELFIPSQKYGDNNT